MCVSAGGGNEFGVFLAFALTGDLSQPQASRRYVRAYVHARACVREC